MVSGGVDAIPLVGGVLSELMDLTDRSVPNELADLQLTLNTVRARLKSHDSIIDAITAALPDVPAACRSNLELLQAALKSPNSPPEEFVARLKEFFARFDSLKAFASKARATLADHERRIAGCESRIDRLENVEMLSSGHVLKLIETALDERRKALDERQKAEEAVTELAQKLGVAEGVISAFLAELGQAEVPREKWAGKLMEFAREHKALREKLSADPDRPVLDAIDAGDLDLADRLLAGRCAELDERKGLTLERRGDLAKMRLLYRQAAGLYAEAAALSPDDPGRRLALLGKEADVLQDHGDEFGDNDALREAIDLYRELLREMPRADRPLDWAVTQNNLGLALQGLGEWESGTERLEQAAEAYRLALEERTRDRVPLKWAATQNNLGVALAIIGERERNTKRLKEAVAAYRLALEERTRDRVPLEWAMTQNNLGNALLALGERERSTKRLKEAAEAYRLALEERTRDRVPLKWAGTQNNLGEVLRALGEREPGTERLEQAVAALRLALEERTRDRVPLKWATTQNNLGNALRAIGERESGTERIEEAVTAYRLALEVFEAARAGNYVAIASGNLARVAELIRKRRGA